MSDLNEKLKSQLKSIYNIYTSISTLIKYTVLRQEKKSC